MIQNVVKLFCVCSIIWMFTASITPYIDEISNNKLNSLQEKTFEINREDSTVAYYETLFYLKNLLISTFYCIPFIIFGFGSFLLYRDRRSGVTS